MPGGSLIGSLRVALGLDSAQFTAGLAKARGEIGGFSNSAKIGFAAVGAAALAAGTALGVAVKRSLDHADSLGKMAQKAGTSVEALSRLEYAARLSDVSMEGLTGSLTKLGKAMVDASVDKGGQAATAFQALGINVRDASGNLRDTSAVFADVADRFGRMQDGATKGTLAMQLFGKSGAELIPLLNSGSNGLKAMADESDRVGFTLSKNTTAAAEGANDAMTRLGLALEGGVNKLLPKLAPMLTDFTNALSTTDPQLVAVVASVTGLATAAGIATPAVTALTGATKLLYAQLALIAALPAGVLAIAGGAYLGSTTPVGAGEDALIKKLGLTTIPPGSAWKPGGWGNSAISTGAWGSGWGSEALTSSLGVKPTSFDFRSFLDPLTSPLKSLFTSPGSVGSGTAQAIGGAWSGGWGSSGLDLRSTDEIKSGLSSVLSGGPLDFDKMKKDLADLAKLHDSTAISATEYGQAVVRTYANVAASAFDMASGVTGALASMFKDNKAFAISNAIVQTLSGVANAIGSGPPPWSFINAGIAAATGAANVANILATNEHSTSVPSSGASGGAASVASASPSQAFNIHLQGASVYSSGQVEKLLESIADAMGDGAGTRMINIIKA